MKSWWNLDLSAFIKALRVKMSFTRNADSVEFHSEMRAKASEHVAAFKEATSKIDGLVADAFVDGWPSKS